MSAVGCVAVEVEVEVEDRVELLLGWGSSWDDPELNQVLRSKTPWPDLGHAEDVAKATTFLASGDAGWASGSLLTIDADYTAP